MLQMILIINIVIGLICVWTRNKGNIVSILILLFLFLNFAAAQSTLDSYAYSTAFNAIVNGYSFSEVNNFGFGFDFGFLFVMKIVSLLTSDYLFFRAIIFCIGIFFIIKSIKMIDNRSIIPILFYMLFPFAYDTFQIAFFLAYTIVCYGLTLLIKEKNHCILKYTIIVIIASLIHKSALLFLVFLLFKLKLEKFRKMMTILVIFFVFVNIFLRVNLVQIVNDSLPFIINIFSAESYVQGSQLNILTIIMSISLNLLLYYYSFCLYKDECSYEYKNLFLINSVSLLFLPFIYVSLDFERLFRPLLIINYTYISHTAILKNKKRRLLELIIVLMIIFRFILCWNYFDSNNNDILQYFF